MKFFNTEVVIMENKKDKKVALNDELLDKVSGGSDENSSDEWCECGFMLAPGGVCMNPFCSYSNTHSPAFDDAVDTLTEIVGNITFP